MLLNPKKTVCAIDENDRVVLRNPSSVAFQFAPYEPIIRQLDLKIRETERQEAQFTQQDVLQAVMSDIDKKTGGCSIATNKILPDRTK